MIWPAYYCACDRILSESGERVSRKRLLERVRKKRKKILKLLFIAVRESCAFIWLSVKGFGASCNKDKK